MNTITHNPSSIAERANFIDILSDEFTGKKGFGVYAFLSVNDIENLYRHFLGKHMPARDFSRAFVRNF